MSASHKELAAGAAQVQRSERWGTICYIVATILVLLAYLLMGLR